MHLYEYRFPLPPPLPGRYVPEAVLFPTDPNFLQFHKVFEAFQVSSCLSVSLPGSMLAVAFGNLNGFPYNYDINNGACKMYNK